MNEQVSSSLAQRKREIAQRIRLARRHQGWTQQQVADLLGCSRKRYNSMERGQTELGVTELEFLAQKLNIPILFFFEQTDRGDVNLKPNQDGYDPTISTDQTEL